MAQGDRVPIHFGPEANVRWKTEVPPGHSSPVIWDNQIFLTAVDPADRKTLITMAVDLSKGRILWSRTIQAETQGRFHTFNNPASSTPAVDERNVYAYFGTWGLICCNHAGKEIWRRKIETPPSKYGMATSPILYKDMVILVLDGDHASSRLLALRKNSGETVWEQQR